jgi:glycosyltransferase involved in cell wall biosynthesis
VDPRHFRFLGRIPPAQLAALWSLSDLHVYLTVPFVLSWSLLDAMACACPIVGSDTPPVREVIHDGIEGRLAPFHDVEALACAGLELLADPERARALGDAARRKVEASYSLDVSFPLTLRFFDSLINSVQRGTASGSG